ncbi:MAG: hypothetical protein M3R38_11250 [Actinomycetota bacterium]|nr:hypothetical protein [Actinomycetota bacterium]
MAGGGWCYGHDPSYAEKRRRNASQGGRTGGRGRGANGELAQIKDEIRRVTTDVLGGEVKTSVGAVALQGLNSSLRALEIERRTFDVAALVERLELLEDRADQLRGA